jgi:cbb3-type cytochrome oxidase subunit 3
MRAFLVILFTMLVALGAGALGFQAGVASSVASGTGGVPAIVYLGGGFHFGGFLFFLLFVGLVLFAFGSRRRHWAGHGATGGFGSMDSRGPWSRSHGPTGDGDPRREWIVEAHRRLHEEEAARAARPATGSAAGTTGGTATGTADGTTDGTPPAA